MFLTIFIFKKDYKIELQQQLKEAQIEREKQKEIKVEINFEYPTLKFLDNIYYVLYKNLLIASMFRCVALYR